MSIDYCLTSCNDKKYFQIRVFIFSYSQSEYSSFLTAGYIRRFLLFEAAGTGTNFPPEALLSARICDDVRSCCQHTFNVTGNTPDMNIKFDDAGHPCHQVKPSWQAIIEGGFTLSLELTGTDLTLKVNKFRIYLDVYEWFDCQGGDVVGRHGVIDLSGGCNMWHYF